MQKYRIKPICITAMMTAMSIIVERMIVPTFQGQPFRFDLGNVPILVCGIACGPFWAGMCGVIGDILGCYFNGYAPFLPLTLSPLLVGVLPSFAVKMKKSRKVFFSSVVLTYLVAEIMWTPFALSMMKGTPYGAEFAVNLPAASIQTVVDIVLVYAIIKSRILERTGLVSK